MEHAKKRGAKIYAEVVGYGATSDGYDMVAPSGEGAVRCMQLALEGVEGDIDYINTHGTSTPDRKSTRLNSVTNAHLVCRLLLEKKKQSTHHKTRSHNYSTT